MSVCFRHCRWCAVEDCALRITDEVICDRHKPKPKQTNADRIKSMTDEELAEYIDKHFTEPMWCNSPPEDCPPHETCKLCILDWLKSPADKEG